MGVCVCVRVFGCACVCVCAYISEYDFSHRIEMQFFERSLNWVRLKASIWLRSEIYCLTKKGRDLLTDWKGGLTINGGENTKTIALVSCWCALAMAVYCGTFL